MIYVLQPSRKNKAEKPRNSTLSNVAAGEQENSHVIVALPLQDKGEISSGRSSARRSMGPAIEDWSVRSLR